MIPLYSLESYFKKFEDSGARNEIIPNGDYDVTVEYDDLATPKYKVIKIMKGTENIEVKQFSHIDFKGIDIFIMSLYSKYKTIEERQRYTDTYKLELYKIVSFVSKMKDNIGITVASHLSYLNPIILSEVVDRFGFKFVFTVPNQLELTTEFKKIMTMFDSSYLKSSGYRDLFESTIMDIIRPIIDKDEGLLFRLKESIQDNATASKLTVPRQKYILYIFDDVHSILPLEQEYVDHYNNMKAKTKT